MSTNKLKCCGILMLSHAQLLHVMHPWVACKRRSSVNSGAWLWRFDDVTGVEKSCVAKGVNRKKAKEKYLFIVETYFFETYFFVPELLWNSDKQNLSNFRIGFFYHSVISPFAIKLFLLPFISHCSTQNIGFSDSGYVIKPPQPSSAFYRVPAHA